MTRWCPVCESPGRPIVRGALSQDDGRAHENGSALPVRERLPGIEPSHFCTWCPTFFRARDRFYLTARDEIAVHGIAVWPHREARIRFELGDDHILALFADSSSVLIPGEAFGLILSDFFTRRGGYELVQWASRRGFDVRLRPAGRNHTDLEVDPAGPHFPLLVIKSWTQADLIRTRDVLTLSLEDLGVEPVEFVGLIT